MLNRSVINFEIIKESDCLTYLTNSGLDRFPGKPTRRGWKFDGVPTLCERISCILALSVRSWSLSWNDGPRMSFIRVSHDILIYKKRKKKFIYLLKWHYSQFSLQNLGCTSYKFQKIAINNDK